MPSKEVKGQDSKLIFLHGAGSSREFWHEQRAAFPEAHHLNLPGHSEARDRDSSSAGEGMRSISEYADWVEDYVGARHASPLHSYPYPGSVILNGHSMGGAITLELALRRPPWLRAIVLTGTGARLRVAPRLLELLRDNYPAAVDFIIEKSFAPASGLLTYRQRARINGVRRQMLRTPRQVTLQDYEACDRFDVMARLGEINVPALCIVGADDRMTPPNYTEYLHEKIENSHVQIINGAGHLLPFERPEEYNSVLAKWLLYLVAS